MPGDYAFTVGDNGAHTFTGVVLKAAGSQSVTATDTADGSVTGSALVNVTAAAATHFSVVAPVNVTAGTSFNVLVTALDAFNNTATGYSGTVHLTSSDASAVLPANSTLTNGTKTFT